MWRTDADNECDDLRELDHEDQCLRASGDCLHRGHVVRIVDGAADGIAPRGARTVRLCFLRDVVTHEGRTEQGVLNRGEVVEPEDVEHEEDGQVDGEALAKTTAAAAAAIRLVRLVQHGCAGGGDPTKRLLK